MYEESPFCSEWARFILNLQRIASRKLARQDGQAQYSADTQYKNDLRDLLDDVIEKLRSPAQLDVMFHASALEDRFVVDCYKRELKCFNDWVENRSAQTAAEDDDELDAGEKVKSSVDTVISKLPEFLKKLIHILNELLKLIILAS